MTRPAGVEFAVLDFADEAAARAVYEIGVRGQLQLRPDSTPPTFEEWVSDRGTEHPDAREYQLVVSEQGVPRGMAMVWLPTQENTSMSWVKVEIDPAHRGRGLGAALLTAMEERLDPERTTITGPLRIPLGSWSGVPDDHPQVAFFLKRGYRISTTAKERKLTLPVRADLLDEIRAEIRPHCEGYRIETYVDGVPATYLDSLGALKGILDVDAPSGDLEWEAAPVSPEEYAHFLRQHAAVGRRPVETIAVSKDGEVVAYTETVVRPTLGQSIWQEGTLVHRDHRGHRLGLAVKAANIEALMELGDLTDGRSIVTENDDANQPMIAVNERFGFVETELEIVIAKDRTATYTV